jgi:hypothetical protein
MLFPDRRLVAARFHRQQKTLRDRIRDGHHCGSRHHSLPVLAAFKAAFVLSRFLQPGLVAGLSARPAYRQVFFFFQRRSPRASSLAPR